LNARTEKPTRIKRSPWLVGRGSIEGNGGDVLASNLARLMYIPYILAIFKLRPLVMRSLVTSWNQTFEDALDNRHVTVPWDFLFGSIASVPGDFRLPSVHGVSQPRLIVDSLVALL
jgi:hypothetical protein